jgi:ribosomal protein S27AE
MRRSGKQNVHTHTGGPVCWLSPRARTNAQETGRRASPASGDPGNLRPDVERLHRPGRGKTLPSSSKIFAHHHRPPAPVTMDGRATMFTRALPAAKRGYGRLRSTEGDRERRSCPVIGRATNLAHHTGRFRSGRGGARPAVVGFPHNSKAIMRCIIFCTWRSPLAGACVSWLKVPKL